MRKRLKQLIPFGEIALVYFIFYLLGIGCPIRFLTGVSCAGCGMTRAWQSMLKLDFRAAFHFHPLVLLPVAFTVLFIIRGRINEKLYKAVVVVMIALVLGVYVFRMLDPNDDIVVFDIGNNIIAKIYNYFKEVI